MKVGKGVPGTGNSMHKSCGASNPSYVPGAAESQVWPGPGGPGVGGGVAAAGPGRAAGQGHGHHGSGAEPVRVKMDSRGLACLDVGFGMSLCQRLWSSMRRGRV